MGTASFNWNGATLSVREARGRDVVDAPWVLFDLIALIGRDQGVASDEEINAYDWGAADWFVGMLMRTTIEGEFVLYPIGEGEPIAWPDYRTASAEEIYEAFNRLMDSSPKLVHAWRQAAKKSNLEVPVPEDTAVARKSSRRSQAPSSDG